MSHAHHPEKEIEHLREELKALRKRIEALEDGGKKSRAETGESVAIVCFSGEWDRLFAAFTIANGALALGKEVHMFFTFWAASALRKHPPDGPVRRSFLQKLIGWMLPRGIGHLPLSKMNFFGFGKVFMGVLMKQKGVESLEDLMRHARELGANFYCCDTSLDLFGWQNADLVEGDASKWCGVSTFLSKAFKANVTLFI